MQSCLLISSLPPTRIKSYLLTIFWSPNQYYYRPNIETPRLCHHHCLLARLVTTHNGLHTCCHQLLPHLVPVPAMFYCQRVLCLEHRYLSSESSGSQLFRSYNSTPRSVLCWPRACGRVTQLQEGFEAGVRPLCPPGPLTLQTMAQLPPVSDQARPSGHRRGWAPLKGWKHSRCADSDNSLGRPGRVYAAGPNMGGVGISGLTTTVYNNTGSQ